MSADVSGEFGSLTDGAGLAYVQPNMASNSLEQLYSPIEIRKQGTVSGSLSSLEIPEILGELPAGGTEHSSGRFGDNKHVGPTRFELDPYFSNILNASGDGSDWIAETDFQMMVNDGDPVSGAGDLNIRKQKVRKDISAVRASALRGPILLSGWGYDIADRAAPKAGVDNVFSHDGEVVNNRGVWKTGPVNLQWDEERKVWQGGPQIVSGVVVGEIKAPISPCHPEEFIVKLFRKGNSELGGEPPEENLHHNYISACEAGETITVTNRDPSLTQEAVRGMIWCVATRINYEWIPLWIGCPEGPAPTGCTEINEDGVKVENVNYPRCANCDCDPL
jgi:hypothetical protein